MSSALGRLLFVIALLSFVVLGGLALPAHATTCGFCTSQGARVNDVAGDANGVRAYLAGSGHLNGSGTILSSVAIQTNTVGQPGWIQMGEIQTSTDQVLNDCGAGVIEEFVEWGPANSNVYHCPYTQAINPFGVGHQYTLRYTGSGWQGREDGTTVWPADGGSAITGFAFGYPFAVVESKFNYGDGGQSLAMSFGPTGHTAWGSPTTRGRVGQRSIRLKSSRTSTLMAT